MQEIYYGSAPQETMGSRIGMGKKQSKGVISEKPQDLRNTRYTTVWPQIKGAGLWCLLLHYYP